MDERLVRLCAASEVTEDTPARVEVEGVAYAVFLLKDTYHVLEDTCSHGPGSLSEGYVEGEEVECPFHQGRFHIPTGQPTLAPCTIPMRAFKPQLIGEDLYFDRSA
jgi:nitrite reductase/ring-hydroxylating ferredoxin subunit